MLTNLIKSRLLTGSRYHDLREWGKEHKNNFLVISALMLGFFIGLGLGRIINSGRPADIIIDRNIKTVPATALIEEGNGTAAESRNLSGGNFSASISGAAYYPIGCAAANRIKEENRIWFETKGEAEAAGYRPAQNCPGF